MGVLRPDLPIYERLIQQVRSSTPMADSMVYQRSLMNQPSPGFDFTTPGTSERHNALVAAGRQSSAALGIIGAVGALGGFLIPVSFNSPWVTTPLAATKAAFVAFTVFYLICALVCATVYLRPRKASAAVLADVRI